MARARSSAPTITTVAKHANVSPMTVSRVLDGGKNVRPELVARVQASVEALGYRRNEQARSLRPGQRSGLIGVAITNIANPYYAEFLLGVDEVVTASGRRVMIGSTSEDAGRERGLLSDFIGRQVEGLIVVPTGRRQHLSAQALGGIPLVLASRAVPGLSADCVLVADVEASYRATSALLRAGHRNIAFLGNQMSVFTGQRRYDGYALAHHDADVEVRECLVRRAQQDVSSADAAMTELLAGDCTPTAVFCANNRNTVGAVRALSRARRDRAMTSTVTLVGFDDFEFADLVDVPLLIIDHDARELGRQAARMLTERLAEPDANWLPRTLELPTQLIDHGTGLLASQRS